MQDPPEVIPKMLEAWENGFMVVTAIKSHSKENGIMYFLRKCYYSIVQKISEIDHIAQFTGFGLYDLSFIKTRKALDDSLPYLRGIVAELAPKRTSINYQQEKRKHGVSSFNFLKLYDIAMLGITSYSKVVMRVATILGLFLSSCSALIAIISLVIKITNWNYFSIGTAAMVVGVFTLGSIQLFFIGMLGEYLININIRTLKRSLVIEEKRLNFVDAATSAISDVCISND